LEQYQSDHNITIPEVKTLEKTLSHSQVFSIIFGKKRLDALFWENWVKNCEEAGYVSDRNNAQFPVIVLLIVKVQINVDCLIWDF
jgi:hypothetical protein